MYFYFNCGNLKLALAEIFIAFLLFVIRFEHLFYYQRISEDVDLVPYPERKVLIFPSCAIFLVRYSDINDDNVGRFYGRI